MRVFLMAAPSYSDEIFQSSPPNLLLKYGLVALASRLRDQGIPFAALDADFALRYPVDRAGLTGARPAVSRAVDPGRAYDVLVDQIVESGADVVGFSVWSPNLAHSIELARRLRAARPEVTIVLGGPEARASDGELLTTFPFIDVVVRGEGEETLVELLRALVRGRPLDVPPLPGITCRSQGAVLRAPDRPPLADLDSLPLPDWELVYPDLNAMGLRTLLVEAGRGCPFDCTYCLTSRFWSRRYRVKSASRVAAEVLAVVRRHGIAQAELLHDNLAANPRHLRELCAALRPLRAEVRWDCSARLDGLDPDTLTLLRDSGCTDLFFGIEVGSPRMQRRIRKRLDVEAVGPRLVQAAAAGLRATCSFILGFPDEDAREIDATLRLALRCAATPGMRIQISLLVPESGTQVLRDYQDQLRFSRQMLLRSSGLYRTPAGAEIDLAARFSALFPAQRVFEHPQLSRDELERLQRFYLLVGTHLPRTFFVLTHLGASPRTLCAALSCLPTASLVEELRRLASSDDLAGDLLEYELALASGALFLWVSDAAIPEGPAQQSDAGGDALARSAAAVAIASPRPASAERILSDPAPTITASNRRGPCLSLGTRLLRLRFDLLAMLPDPETLLPPRREARRVDTWVAVVRGQDGSGRSLRLGMLAGELATRCDGRTPIAALAGAMLAERGRRRGEGTPLPPLAQLVRAFEQAALRLRELGVLEGEAESFLASWR